MAVAKFSLATSERKKDKEGNWQDHTEWHNLTAFGRTAEIAGEYLKKGRTVYIEGALRTSSWDDKESGQKKYKTEVIVNDLVMLGGAEGAGGGSGRTRGAAAALLILTGCPRQNSAQTLKRVDLRAPEGQPMMLAAYQPWFGRPGHINVGYSSLDRVTLDRQIDEAKNLGIRGFVVNWYGPGKEFEDRSYALMQSLAAEKDFRVALMYDESEDQLHSTDEAIRDLTYAWQHYISPDAPGASAYLTYHDRPVIFIFNKGGKTDWKRVRQVMSSWSPQPLLLYKDLAPEKADVMDGFYAWVHPDHGWSPDGKDWGEGYLNYFYSKMSSRYRDKLAVGAVARIRRPQGIV